MKNSTKYIIDVMKCIKASKVYTGRGDVLEDVYIVWNGDRIVSITREKPKDVEEVYEYDRCVITPASIDAHSHIGMARAGEPSEEEEVNEHMDSVVPLADALASIYMDDPSFRESVEFGVLYSCILPGSGNIIGGRGVLIKNYESDISRAFIKYVGLKVAFGYNPRSVTRWRGTRPSTRMGSYAILRKTLLKALDSLKLVEKGKKDIEEIDPDIRALFPVLKGEEYLRIHVHKSDDILVAIKLCEEFNIKFTIEHALDVNDPYIFKILKDKNIPLVYGPIDSFPYKTELKHFSWRNIKYLVEIRPYPLAVMSDHPVVLQRNLLLQLRFFTMFGMKFEEAIRLITLEPAIILNIDKDLGSIDVGKLASFVVWNDDLTKFDAYPILIIAEGRKIYEV